MEYVPPYGSTDADESYIDINPATATEGSPVPAAAIEHPMREIMAVINAAGLTPDAENLSQLLEALQSLFVSNSISLRTRLTANTTFCVATTGNDATGDGTAGAPWATIQKAWDTITTNYDPAGHTATISVGDGTHNLGLAASGPVFNGTIVLQGNTATPANCIFSTTNTSCISAANGATVFVKGFKLTTTASGDGLTASKGGRIFIDGNMDYGVCAGTHINAFDTGSSITNTGNNYTISGGAKYHYLGNESGNIRCAGCTVTLTGTPAFGIAFAAAGRIGFVNAPSVSFSGSATGVRYIVNINGVINTDGGGESCFPGNVAGITDSASGGVYA